MIVHSIKSIVRTPKKTILFLLLIALLSLFLSVGTGMYQSADNMIKQADETFTTVVDLTYLGNKGEDAAAFYEQMNKDVTALEHSKLQQHPDVLSTNIERTASAYIEGKQINQSLPALDDYVIIEAFNLKQFDESRFQGIINTVYFGENMRQDTYVMVSQYGLSEELNFVHGHKYLIVGKKSAGLSPTPIVTPILPDGIEGFATVVDLTEFPDFFESEMGIGLQKIAEALNVVRKSLPVTLVSSFEAVEPYFSRDLVINKGRIFNEEEYQKGKNEVILISKAIAEFYGVEVGDKLELKLHYAKNGTGLSNYIMDYSFSKIAEYEIVGIFENKYDNRYTVYMPMDDWIEQDCYSVRLARYVVKNGSGEKFIKDNADAIPSNMSFTIYDQGYEEAINPIMELKNTAILLQILGAVSGTIILLLFSYLYVIKQRDTIVNMLALGAGKRRTISYVLFGSLLLVLLASVTGSFLSSGFVNSLTNNIFEKMIALYKTDLRYSERAIGVQLEYAGQVSTNYWLPVLIILLMLVVSFVLLYGFTIFIKNEEKYKIIRNRKKSSKRHKKLKTVQPKVNKEQNVLFGRVRPIPLKFALVSILRNSGRSLIVPVLTLVLSAFLVFLSFLSNIQQEKRDTVYDRIPVNTYLTSFKNETRSISLNLQYDVYRFIDPEYNNRMEWDWEMYYDYMDNGEYTAIRAHEERQKLLEDSAFFREIYLSREINYEYMGISKTKDGVEKEDIPSRPEIRSHSGAFGFDWFIELIYKMPRLAYADDIRYTSDFFNSSGIEVEFLEGYDFDCLKMLENVGIISRNFANVNGVELGDTIRITAWNTDGANAFCSIIDFLVAGIYEEEWRSDVIYLPWIMSYEHNYFYDGNYPSTLPEDGSQSSEERWNETIPRSVHSATFTLKNTQDLAPFRDYLVSKGYSEAGKINVIRNAVVIQDKQLEETIRNLDNYIRIMNILVPIMLVLFGVIGFVVSYLLIRHRLNELAIMRSIGSRKYSVFLSFFVEQLILFTIGLLPVIIFGIVFPDYFIYYGISLGYYIISYLSGTGVALIILSRTKLLDILFSKE